MNIFKKLEKRLNKGILSYDEVKELRDTLDTKEYNSLVLKSIGYWTLWDYITYPFTHTAYIISETWYSVKTFTKNVWRFRKILKSYQGWDYGYDIKMLIKMYEIKIRSFEIACEYIEEGPELLEEVKGIYNDLVWLDNADEWDKNYTKVYAGVFKKMQKSYKFWW